MKTTLNLLYDIYIKHPIICTDTRNIKNDCIFFALKGDNFDANLFAKEALNNGAAYVVIDNQSVLDKNDPRYILVDNVLLTLQNLANFHRKHLNIPIIAITGTNGKTTTKELLCSVLSQKYNTIATKGNLNNHIGVPLTVLSINNQHQVAIVEMGANHPSEIKLLASIAEPTMGIITNVGKAHLEGFGSFDGVKKSKKELYDYLEATSGLVFINGDNLDLIKMAENIKKKFVYSKDNSADIIGKVISSESLLSVAFNARSANWININSKLVGEYNFENILAAISIGYHLGLSYEEIKNGIEIYKPENNRSQITKTETNSIICDFYNANPSSMSVAIENFSKIDLSRKLVILGDMFELGEYSDTEHLNIVKMLSSRGIDKAILIGQNFHKIKQPSNYLYFTSLEQAKEHLIANKVQNYTILVKGSRGMKLEELMPLL